MTGEEVSSCLFLPISEDAKCWRLCLGEPEGPLEENTGNSPDRTQITCKCFSSPLGFCPWIPYRDPGKGQQLCLGDGGKDLHWISQSHFHLFGTIPPTWD